MSITHRAHVVAALIAAGAAAGCGGASDGVASPVAATSTVGLAADTETDRTRPSPEQLALFVTRYRKAYPALAAGRTDKGIANDADNTCFDLAREEATAVVQKHVAGRFERNGVVPDNKTVTEIIKLIRLTACPAPR